MTPERMTTKEVLDAIERERARLEDALRAIGDRSDTTPVTEEGWTAKDVIGHMNHWAGQIAFGMGAKVDVPPYIQGVSGRPSEDEWNARAVAYSRDQAFEEVKARFDEVVDALIARIRERTDDEMNATDAIPWGGDRPLWQQIGSETFNHWPEHAESIERATKAGVQ
jgi:hypothetical protein